MRKRLLALSLISGLVAFTLVVMPVYAETSTDETSNSTTVEDTTTPADSGDDKTTTQRKNELRKKLREEAATRKQEYLADAKLKVCEKREAKINTIMAKRVTQAEKHMAVFDKIATRVKTFYTDKSLTVATYDELVADIDAAKVKAEATLAELKDTETFKCDAEDPKAIATDFKTYHKQLREDLKAYRTAIKDLIVAVKSSQEGGLN
ncbi:MAG TPA: hypothetical protein VLF43_00285 [Candidatus Saccharimonadales bacterium]|nr:hypothetical protein [Candidatus Saccharimonadales bacterium]